MQEIPVFCIHKGKGLRNASKSVIMYKKKYEQQKKEGMTNGQNIDKRRSMGIIERI